MKISVDQVLKDPVTDKPIQVGAEDLTVKSILRMALASPDHNISKEESDDRWEIYLRLKIKEDSLEFSKKDYTTIKNAVFARFKSPLISGVVEEIFDEAEYNEKQEKKKKTNN